MTNEQIWKQYEEIYKDRSGTLVKDGIVCEEKYAEAKILLFLKEANQTNNDSDNDNLANNLFIYKPWEMWLRVAEWVYGISNTNKYCVPAYTELQSKTRDDKHEEIKKIAVININKADGTGTPDKKDINKRLVDALESNQNLLKAEIALSEPRIIICGGTYWYFQKLYNLPDMNGYKDYITADLGENKNVLIINSCHPAAHVSSLMSYYGITNIYQQALKEGWQR